MKQIMAFHKIHSKMILSLILIVFVLLSASGGKFNPIMRIADTENYIQPANLSDNEFMIGVTDVGCDYSFDHILDLNLNTWHKYTGAVPSSYGSQGWYDAPEHPDPNDRYDNPVNMYSGNVTTQIGRNRTNGMKTIMDRPKIWYLTSGQRSDYQCEQSNLDADYLFYSYSGYSSFHSDVFDDDPNYGSNSWVRYCGTPTQYPVPQVVVSGLIANHEQANNYWWYSQKDNSYAWYIMPRIRADKDYINNNSNWNNPVCRIDILDWNGNAVTSYPNGIILYSKNFRRNLSTQYNGEYFDKFYFVEDQDPSFIKIDPGLICPPPNKNIWNWCNSDIQTDFRVYWYGQCDMWIDYVRVENEPAYQLFDEPINIHNWPEQIRQEVALALADYQQTGYVPNNFYREEFEFNMTPCIGKVNQIIRDYAAQFGADISLMVNLNYALFKLHVPDCNGTFDFTSAQLKRFLIDTGYAKTLVVNEYPFEGWNEQEWPNRKSYHPSTLATWTWDNTIGHNSYPSTPAFYDDWLQQRLDVIPGPCGGFTKVMKLADGITKIDPDIRIINMHQSHFLYGDEGALKEPSNEEMDVMANLAISYGAKGILHYYYPSWGNLSSQNYDWGLTNFPGIQPRITNVYGQPKWQKIIDMHERFKTWGPYLMSFDNTNRQSYIYRIQSERNALIDETYFHQIQAFAPNPLDLDNPVQDPDLSNSTYVQAAVFKNPAEDNVKYFMIVNRRCSPYLPEQYEPGGRREIITHFDANFNSSFSNWKIIDVEDENTVIKTINTSTLSAANLGWFAPGQGRLYKMVPVTLNGGELAGNETIPAGSYTIIDTIFTNGYNLTIEEGASLHFTDSSTIVVNGGKFTAGDINYGGTNHVIFNNVKKGLTFNNADVRIYNSQFSGINNDTSYAVNIVNCPVADIRKSDFTSGSNTYSGGINMTYYTEPEGGNNIYLSYNTFNAGTSTIPFVNIMSYSGTMVPALVEHNTFTSSSGACGLMLSGVTGGAVKSNTFTDFARAVCALSSSIDVYGNTFTNESATSTGLEGLSGTELRLNKVSRTFIGGLNNFSNNQSSSRNILVDYSYYLLDGGENVFNIGSDNESKHLRGSFPYPVPVSTNATVNCFKIEQVVSNPAVDVTSNGSPVSFVFEPYLTGCTPGEGGDGLIISLGDGIYDTVSVMAGSGGESSIKNKELRMKNGETIANSKSEIENSRFEITAKQIYDSICIQMRYRNYSYVKTNCEYMLNAYPDSIETIYAAHKLYLAVSVTDTTSSGITALKTLYESVILNHPNNTALVNKCNYLVQKCKVLLHQYNSALAGFQQIINNNPYSYEGLVAHWDYMATSLLVQGQGGSEREMSNVKHETEEEFDRPLLAKEGIKGRSEEESNDPNDKFTKEERKQITKTVTQSYETTKESGKKKIEMLTKQASEGNLESAKEVKQMRTLEQVVTIQKPKNLFEHINIVKNDLKRVFGNDNSGSSKNNNVLPTQFMLSQNYPNPFNPSTIIKYALPKDVKVIIKIYDILGREVQTLVNEFKKAGYYDVKFNGNNFASGVYFYRIETTDFTLSKKMVLIK